MAISIAISVSISDLPFLYSVPGTYPIYPQQVEQRCQSLVSTIQSGQQHRGVIGLLVDEVNPLVSVMKVDKAQCAAPNCALGASDLCCTSEHQWNQLSFAVLQAPTESYADIGGLEDQIMEMKEAPEWQRRRCNSGRPCFDLGHVDNFEAVELPLTHPELYEANDKA